MGTAKKRTKGNNFQMVITERIVGFSVSPKFGTYAYGIRLNEMYDKRDKNNKNDTALRVKFFPVEEPSGISSKSRSERWIENIEKARQKAEDFIKSKDAAKYLNPLSKISGLVVTAITRKSSYKTEGKTFKRK